MIAEQAQQKRHTVLLVDDDPLVLITLKNLMERDDHEVICANSGEEALHILESILPNIVLTDLVMPGIDGFTLCRRIKQNPQFALTPVVIVTGQVSSSDFKEGIQAGAADYIKKPFDQAETRMRVRNLIRLHESLREKNSADKRLNIISRAAKDGILLMNDQGIIEHWNEAAESMFGHSRQEAIGQNLYRLIVPEQFHAQHLRAFSLFQRTGQGAALGETLELVGIRKSGEKFPIALSLSVASVDDRWHAVGIIRDITKQKLLHTQLAHARKLEAVGQLASGIAHEINTPTQFVGDSIHFLKDAFEDLLELIVSYRRIMDTLGRNKGHEALLAEIREAEENADLEYLEENVPNSFVRCLDGLSRIASIVGSMKEFAHPDQREMSPSDINAALMATLTIAKNEYKYVADAVTELGELPLVVCHVGDLNQVFLNLIVNAAHAITDVVGDSGDKGTILLRTRQEGNTVSIEIKDTGCGIPDPLKDRIFDPFFTTKEVGKGSGQGLAIAHSIITEKHAGTLIYESEEGKGTTFTIHLPVDGHGEKSIEVAP